MTSEQHAQDSVAGNTSQEAPIARVPEKGGVADAEDDSPPGREREESRARANARCNGRAWVAVVLDCKPRVH